MSRPALPMGSRVHGGSRASRAVVLAGAAVASLLFIALAIVSGQDRRAAIAEQQEKDALHARVLEDHITRSVDTVAVALAAVGEGAPAGDATPSLLRQVLPGLPHLRALALVTLQGDVLESTTPGQRGMSIDVRRLTLPSVHDDALSPFLPGRDLAALALDAPRPPVPEGLGFVPLVRRVAHASGDRLLVAVLNPDYWVNHMQRLMDDPHTRVTLASLDGRVIVDTGRLPAGSSLAHHPVFQALLPRQDEDRYFGTGVGPGQHTVAYRVSRTRPLVVAVQRDLGATLAPWRERTAWRAGTTFVLALTVGLLAGLTARSIRTGEAARQGLDEAQAQVARSEHELSVIVRSVQELLFRTDTAGRLTFVNAHWYAAAGDPSEPLLGKAFADLLAPQERPEALALFGPEGTLPREATVTLWAGEARARRVHVVVVPLDEPGAEAGFAGSAVDITEQEEARARLAEQLAFSALVQDMSPLPTSLVDTRGCYVSVNRAWEQFMGRGRERMIGRPAADDFLPSEGRDHALRDQALLQSGGAVRYEATRRDRNGTPCELLVDKVVVTGRDGRPVGVLSTFTDVTRLHDAAKAVQEARDAAEETSRAKSAFIANVSHELRTPLQSIIGFSELGAHRSAADGRLLAMFEDILASGQRMLGLVNDLLDVSKIESPVGTIHLERTDIRPLVRDVVRELSPLLGVRGLLLHVEIPPVPLVAKLDPNRFQQVVRNLLANAIKFSPEGGTLDIVLQADDDGTVQVVVRDHGPGIPPTELETIFEAFMQSSRTRSGSGGTGLGLAICRTIVQAHGGTISAANAAGGGSRFTVSLPPRATEETRAAAL